MIIKKKKSQFEEELAKSINKPKELWKTLTSLGLSSEKTNKSSFSQKRWCNSSESTGKPKYFQKVLL